MIMHPSFRRQSSPQQNSQSTRQTIFERNLQAASQRQPVRPELEALIDGTPYEPPVKETVVEDVVEEEPVDEGSAGGGLPDTYDEPAPEEMEAP